MISPLLSLFVIFCLLCLSEVLWRANLLRGEGSRKFVHISVGTFVAFWPFFMAFRTIQIISLVFLAAVIFAKNVHIFHAIHSVKRKTWGEFLYAIIIGLLAVFVQSKWIFAAAVLHMSLADGLAAVVGKRYGGGTRYKILGQSKSVIGSATFLIMSVVITAWIILSGSAGFDAGVWPTIIWLPVGATLAENLGVYGTDNILVPLLVVVALKIVS